MLWHSTTNKQVPVLERIANFSNSFSGQHIVLARYIVQDPDTAAFMDSVQLSEAQVAKYTSLVKPGLKGIDVVAWKSVEETVKDADVVATCTPIVAAITQVIAAFSMTSFPLFYVIY